MASNPFIVLIYGVLWLLFYNHIFITEALPAIKRTARRFPSGFRPLWWTLTLLGWTYWWYAGLSIVVFGVGWFSF